MEKKKVRRGNNNRQSIHLSQPHQAQEEKNIQGVNRDHGLGCSKTNTESVADGHRTRLFAQLQLSTEFQMQDLMEHKTS